MTDNETPRYTLDEIYDVVLGHSQLALHNYAKARDAGDTINEKRFVEYYLKCCTAYEILVYLFNKDLLGYHNDNR